MKKLLVLGLLISSNVFANIGDSGPIPLIGGEIKPGLSLYMSLNRLSEHMAYTITCDILNSNFKSSYPVVLNVSFNDIDETDFDMLNITFNNKNISIFKDGSFFQILANQSDNKLIINEYEYSLEEGKGAAPLVIFNSLDNSNIVTLTNCQANYFTSG